MTALANIVWRGLLAAENILVSATEPELRLKAANTLGQLSAHYTRLVETLDLAARVAELEAAVKRR